MSFSSASFLAVMIPCSRLSKSRRNPSMVSRSNSSGMGIVEGDSPDASITLPSGIVMRTVVSTLSFFSIAVHGMPMPLAF